MSAQKIPLETVQKIRHHIKNALALPESENHPKSPVFNELDEPPEPESLSDLGNLFSFGSLLEDATNSPNSQGNWFISVTNPGAALLKLPGLKLSPGWRIVSYLYRTPTDGIGIVWALPEAYSTTSQLEQALVESRGRECPPRPSAAVSDVMEAVVGDRSPASFMIASILRRELQELGALGRSCSWSHHRLISAPPPQVKWQWRLHPPQDLSPKIRIFPDGKAAIEFFTCRVVAPITLFQHLDRYPLESYRPTTFEREIAIASK